LQNIEKRATIRLGAALGAETTARAGDVALPLAHQTQEVIPMRPDNTIQVEAARCRPGAFAFSYQERAQAPDLGAYDRRHVAHYRYPYAWIVGWWSSYFGLCRIACRSRYTSGSRSIIPGF